MSEVNDETSGDGLGAQESTKADFVPWTSGKDKPSATGASLETQSSAPPAPTPHQEDQAPSLGRIVIVREDGKNDAPGIIAEVFEDTITCNVFRGDHVPHVATQLTQTSAESDGAGWFWPPQV